MPVHHTHRTRVSDASSYDTICDLCGARDQLGSWGPLDQPCPKSGKNAWRHVLLVVHRDHYDTVKDAFPDHNLYVVKNKVDLLTYSLPRALRGENAAHAKNRDDLSLVDDEEITEGNLPFEIVTSTVFTMFDGAPALELVAHADTITNLAIRRQVLQGTLQLTPRVAYAKEKDARYLAEVIALDYTSSEQPWWSGPPNAPVVLTI